MQMKAVSIEEPSRLVQSLTGAILGCGGWVLSRGASDTGTVNMLFEFERQACVEIYSVMIAAGLELSQSGHIRFTELCQCTRSHQQDCGTEIASVDLPCRADASRARHRDGLKGLSNPRSQISLKGMGFTGCGKAHRFERARLQLCRKISKTTADFGL
jgi:hypothetical protein